MINHLTYLEEMIGELLCDELVPPRQLHVTQSQQNPAKCGKCFFHFHSCYLLQRPFNRPVDRAEVVQIAGIVHLLVQLHLEGDLPELLVAPARDENR
jgi:hypothetical protein